MVTRDTAWAQVEAELDALLDLAPPARAAALRELATRSPRLHAEVASLLAYSEGSDRLLELPASIAVNGAGTSPRTDGLEAGARVGAYRILGLVGRGGMGEVYRADRADGLYVQSVALKLIRRDASDQLARFDAERQILADLVHPRIARLLDAGVTPDGQPYMVMEWVDGEQIVAWCAARAADLPTRLRLFSEVAEATAYAHQRLVIHRDIKPGNVLVTADGHAKLLDFGAAKLVAPGFVAQTLQAPMTPLYAAPEQLTGGAVTTATDVYALGLLLFELLTGERPWALNQLSLVTSIHTVLEAEPPLPSRRAGECPHAPVPARALTGDLDAIVARALRKQAARRYATVDALREDVRRAQAAEPVEARAGQRLYALGRALRRNALLAASACAVAVALSIGIVGMAWQADRARAEARKATAVKDFVLDIFRRNSVDNPDGAAARQTTVQQLLDANARSIGAKLGAAPEVRAEMIDTLADLYDQLEEFDRVAALERTRLADLTARDGKRPSTERAQALAELGRALAMSGQYPEATRVLGEALWAMDGIGDDHSAARVQALTTLGLVEYHVRPAQDPLAGEHTAAALALLERYNPASPDRLSALQLLARIADRREHDDALAERDYRAFLALAESAAFRDQPVALGSALDDLGGFLVLRQRYAEAEPLLRRAVVVLDRAEGDGQMDAMLAHQHLGELLAMSGSFAAADGWLQQSLRRAREARQAQRPTTVVPALLDVAVLHLERGRRAEARALLETAMGLIDADDVATARLRAQLYSRYAQLLLLDRQTEQATAALERSEAALVAAAATRSEEHGRNLVLSARIALGRGDAAAATRLLDEVIAGWPPSRSRLPEPYLAAVTAQVDRDLAAGDAEAAARRANALVATVAALPDPAYRPQVMAYAQAAAGAALLAARHGPAAVGAYERALALRERIDEPHSPWLSAVRAGLARARQLAATG